MSLIRSSPFTTLMMRHPLLKSLFFALAVISSMGCFGQSDDYVTLIDRVTLKEVIIKDTQVQLIDVRTPDEFKAGRLPGAQNMNFQDPRFPNLVSALDKSRPVYIYCQSGNRSARAARMMRDLGFTQIIEYKGGYGDWAKHETD